VSPLLRALVIAALAVAASGCPRRVILDLPDGEVPLPDAPDLRDTDLDGLCDGTEATLGLDPGRADTDGDGYPDAIEYSVGSDGRMLDSPARDAVAFLSGVRGSVIDTSVTFSVRGSGETFAAAFSSVPSFLPFSERDASRYYAGSRAIGAVPMENVLAMEGERFVGVRSRVLLVYAITFETPEDETDCMRMYPFLYQVQTTNEGRIYGQVRRWVVVAPPGDAPGRGTWCPPPIEGACR
jgi:hypothetical protein